jgi:hypothetical protein
MLLVHTLVIVAKQPKGVLPNVNQLSVKLPNAKVQPNAEQPKGVIPEGVIHQGVI